VRLIVPILIVGVGVIGMRKLASRRHPPAEIKVPEPVLAVKVQVAQAADYPIALKGFGVAKVLRASRIAPEVSGRVKSVSPQLKVGGIFKRGEVLFEIDRESYVIADSEARSQETRAERTVQKLMIQHSTTSRRLPGVERMRDLAKQEYERVAELYRSDKVGTQSGVDAAERAYKQADDQYAMLKSQVDLLPLQIDEAKAALQAASARRARAGLNLERCSVKAPFDGRVKSFDVNVGDVVSPGRAVLTLADDSVLEISVPVDAVSARGVLQFDASGGGAGGWFGRPAPVDCRVRWSESDDGVAWTGRLERVERLATDTRTVNLAIRVDASAARQTVDGSFPLADGMFCEVQIPGRRLQQVVRLPREAVTLKSKVYVEREMAAGAGGVLKSVAVKVVWFDDEYAYIDSGITNGERVVTTRLIAPLENTRLKSTQTKKEQP
jgi:RND family efflux transporter MFP subunit